MQKHPFHLVSSSPWPIFASISLYGFTSGLAGWFHGFRYADLLALISFCAICYVIVVWQKDVLRESVYQGHHTKAVQRGIMIGFALFIVSEALLFFGFFWAFFHSSLAPVIQIGAQWPPAGIDPIPAFGIPFLNTLLLLSSGASATLAHHALLLGPKYKREAVIGLIVTIIFAIVFIGFQAFEYLTATLTISDAVYGSCFYACTGLHGLHVIIGTLALIVSLVRLYYNQLRADHHLGFELAAIYWHFVDVVWLFLFVVIYYWGS